MWRPEVVDGVLRHQLRTEKFGSYTGDLWAPVQERWLTYNEPQQIQERLPVWCTKGRSGTSKGINAATISFGLLEKKLSALNVSCGGSVLSCEPCDDDDGWKTWNLFTIHTGGRQTMNYYQEIRHGGYGNHVLVVESKAATRHRRFFFPPELKIPRGQ